MIPDQDEAIQVDFWLDFAGLSAMSHFLWEY
jgi:hypothetical protein